MKHFAKRSLSLLLALAMCLSLLAGMTFTASAATVEYRYGSTSEYSDCDNVIYNWGTRGTTATFLSPNAESFYEDNNTSYSALAALSGASSTGSIPSSTLYQALRELMSSAQSYVTEYGDTRDMFAFTDCQNSALTSTKISSFYSGKAIGPDWDSGKTWNREHTWPNSKGDANGDGENDIMMLRPASTSENGSRGNNAYGESSGYYDPNSASGDTYDLRGDVARIVLYVYVRWQDTSSSAAVLFGTNGVIENKEVLLSWMEADPVDTWELGRNDSVESITGTRNVFVDYPELGFLLFDEEVPDGYTSPSGEGSAASYSVTAYSNNTAYGTVSLSGETITATPNTGYYVSGYTVTSGTATVTQSGNTFRVSASSDCSIMISFVPNTTVTLTFMEQGTVGSTLTAYSGDTVTLPTADAPEGYSFVGWTTAAVEDTETQPELLTGTYNATENATLHALYSYAEGGTGESSYVKVTTTPADWSGQYIIVYESDGYIFDGSLTSLDAASNYRSVTITDSTVPADQADAYSFTIAAASSGYSIQSASGRYIGATGNSNSLNSSTSTVYVNTLSMNADGTVNVIGSGGAYLRFNSASNQLRFRYYKSSTYTGQKAIALYAKTESGTTYYTTLTAVEPVALVNGVEYPTFEEAYAASGEGQYIRLLDNIYLDSLEMTKDLYVDLNGKTMEAVVDPGEYTVYGIDTATDQYTASGGWLCLLDQDSSILAPQIHVQADSKRYMAIENDSGWSFHRYYVGITTTVLSTHTTGIGYKAVFYGTDEVVAQLADTQAFGYSLRLEGGSTVTRYLDTVTSGQVVSLRVNNFDVANYSETSLYAKVSVTLGGTVIESAEHSITLRQLVETVNENYTNYPDQLDALAAFVEKYYDTMSAWQVENLYKPE